MKKYKVWIEFEREIEAKNLKEAIDKFRKGRLHLEINGVEIK